MTPAVAARCSHTRGLQHPWSPASQANWCRSAALSSAGKDGHASWLTLNGWATCIYVSVYIHIYIYIYILTDWNLECAPGFQVSLFRKLRMRRSGFASCFQKNFLYTYQVCMFPEKHRGTLREHMGCGVQLSAQPSICIYIFSNRYIHIPRTSKYPEKMLKLWKLCGKLPFLWWLGGSRIYAFLPGKKNMPLEAF